jgi:hypothetical protein
MGGNLSDPWLVAALLIAAGVAALIVLVFQRKPRLDGDWRDHLTCLTQVTRTADGFTVSPMKDWSYTETGAKDKLYGEFAARYDDLKRIWFVVEPNGDSKYTAHTLLLFEFADDRLLAVTVEARLEKNEKWTAWKGLWNCFELFYMWASARDVLLGRAVMLKHSVFVYPTRLESERMKRTLCALLDTTAELAVKPRFYNTLFSNCTNELGKRADIPWHYSFILTGKSAEYLFSKGVIPGAPFSEVRRRADLTEWLRANNGLEGDAFDKLLLTHLRTLESGFEPPPLPSSAL